MSDIEAFAEQVQEEQEVHKLVQKLVVVQNELKVARNSQRASAAQVAELQELLSNLSAINPGDLQPIPWLEKRPKTQHGKHGTAVLMLSDLHLDEVVKPLEMRHINAYDRRIAELRLEHIAHTVVMFLQDNSLTLDGLVLAMLGDIVTGIIHAELERTNEAPLMATIAYWVPKLAAFILFLADELGIPVHIATVDGNHDRSYSKIQSKTRAESSHAWVIYSWLADTLRHDDRITFNISPSSDNEIEIYKTKFLLTHGDGFRSAGGVGGIYPSLLKYLLRSHEIYDFDVALMGHWHQLTWHRDAYINGSLKGYDQYAKDNRFFPERPQQALFVVTPEHGVVHNITVHADTAAEGWQHKRRRR